MRTPKKKYVWTLTYDTHPLYAQVFKTKKIALAWLKKFWPDAKKEILESSPTHRKYLVTRKMKDNAQIFKTANTVLLARREITSKLP
jgi:hypothetical protein